MAKYGQIGAFFSCLWLIAGCGVANRTVKKSPAGRGGPSSSHTHSPDLPAAASVSKINEIRVSLHQAYLHWKGTPYILGGTSHRGIDCSGFMQIVFKRYFGVKLPRTTRRQIHKGRKVSQNALNTGDLIFFKTGRRTLHVGVMLGQNRFLQASTSKGVTISNLGSYYWKSRYLTARRVMKLR